MSQFRFRIHPTAGRTFKALIRPDRDGDGIFLGASHARGVIPRDQARELADNIHDWADQQEQNDPTPKETV